MTEYRPDPKRHPPPGVIKVGVNTEDGLGIGKTGGKRRAARGLPHLPGSSMGRPIWDDYWKGNSSFVGEQADRWASGKILSNSAQNWKDHTTFHNPSTNPEIGALRSTASDSNIPSFVTTKKYTYDFNEHPAYTGKVNHIENSVTDSNGPKHYHGWYHQSRRDKVGRGRPNRETELWAQTIKKSKDHIGYGNGMIGYGDVQSTSLAADCPTWMFGQRMINGVVGSGFPRWPYTMVEKTEKGNCELVCKDRYFQRGPNLSTIETIGGKKPPRFDRQVLDYRQPLPQSTKPQINQVSDKRQSSLIGGGAVCITPRFPNSDYHGVDPDPFAYQLETNRSMCRR